MTTMVSVSIVLLLLSWILLGAFAFTVCDVSRRTHVKMSMTASQQDRRQFILIASVGLLTASAPANAVERAVGSAEVSCRERGDCLEKGEWDGAVGWNWGGRDRCDATDPRCGPDGVLRDAPPTGDPVPPLEGLKVTHQVEITLTLGKSESGTLRFGLYGESCPQSVPQLVQFFAPTGLATSSGLMFEQGYGITAVPVSMAKGGMLTGIAPGQRLDFGVPSQAGAYARSLGKSTAGDDFVPQPRPKEQLSTEDLVRKHSMAGLISIPGKGLGFGGNGMASEDEAFADGKHWVLLEWDIKSHASHSLFCSISNHCVRRSLHGSRGASRSWSTVRRRINGVLGSIGVSSHTKRNKRRDSGSKLWPSID